MFETLKNVFRVKEMRRKLLYVLWMILVIRIGSQLPVPGVDSDFFKEWFAKNTGDAFNFFDAFTGGSFTQMSIFALNITPYITSSIIMQLLTIAIPALEEMQKEPPDILFLDEPTSGIDPLARRTFWRQITALAAKGTTIIITTHFMDEAEYCDRMMIQDQGKTIALGTPDEVRKRGGDNLTMNEAFIAIVEDNRKKEAKENG